VPVGFFLSDLVGLEVGLGGGVADFLQND